MNRRDFLLRSGCAGCALAAGAPAWAQSEWSAPARFARPDIATDEGGLWAMMDREETRLRRSPFAVRDRGLVDYVQDIACRLAGGHCPDVRVHVVSTPLFNASMAPNGMMQVWTGLLLRMENEAQLAAVLGHEIGHYLERHSIERLRDAKSRTAFGQFLGLFGVVGAVGQLAVLAGAFGYSRDQERDADRIGVTLMRSAGYDPAQAARVWANLQLELKARPENDLSRSSPMFATHPSPVERQETLERLAQATPGGDTNEAAWIERIRPFRREWLAEEIRRGQHDESHALLSRMIAAGGGVADYLWARGEVLRLRAKEGDLDAALRDFHAALAAGDAPPDVHRALGAIQRQRGQVTAARESYRRYLESAPAAPDAPMIRSYVEESGS